MGTLIEDIEEEYRATRIQINNLDREISNLHGKRSEMQEREKMLFGLIDKWKHSKNTEESI